jgi:hypothetical protein
MKRLSNIIKNDLGEVKMTSEESETEPIKIVQSAKTINNQKIRIERVLYHSTLSEIG